MATCRCPICGAKNASKKCKNRRLYHKFNLGRDEHNHSWDANSKDEERRLLRRRMKQNLSNEIREFDE